MKCFNNITILFVMFALFSCGPKYYLPTPQKVMVFEHKGDAILSASAGMHGQLGVEAGYAFTDNIGFCSSFSRFDISYYGNSGQFIKDFVWDNELVLYKRYNNGLYAGLNIGTGFGKFNLNNPYLDLGFSRQFIQPSVGVNLFRNTEFAVSTRFTHLSYKFSKLSQMSYYDRYMTTMYFGLTDVMDGPFLFVEPALSCALKYEFFKVQFQYAVALRFNELNNFHKYQSLSTTLSMDINKLFFEGKDKTKRLRWSF